MTISQTGSTVTYSLSGSDPAAQTPSVAGDAKCCLFFWSGWAGSALDLNTLTLGGTSMTVGAKLARSGDAGMVGVAYMLSPPTGTPTLDWSWTGTPAEGPVVQFISLTAGGSITFVAADVDSQTGGFGFASATAASNTGDFAIAMAQRFGANPIIGGTGASAITTYNFNSEHATSFTVTAGAASSTATSDQDYPTVSLITLRETAAAVSDVPGNASSRNMQRNAIYRMSPGGVYVPAMA